MSKVVCEHPRVIMRPNIQQIAAKYRVWYILGKKTEIHSRVHPDNIDLSSFYPRRHGVTSDNIDECFFLDRETGEQIPMYLLVACGKCDCCKLRRVNSDVFRLQLEAECYDFEPWFVTLTYDEQHVRHPKTICRASEKFSDYVYQRSYSGKLENPSCPVEFVPVGGVNVRDCQLFLKRLRINLKRAGFNFNIRYYLVAEYSPLKSDGSGLRPHYHAIIFGINTRTAEDYFNCVDIISKSWSNGFTYCRRINMSDSQNKSFYYTTKYMRKAIGCPYPVGCVKPFVLSSKGNGGIGSKFIDTKIAPKLKKSLDCHFQFLSKWTGQVVDLRYTSYIINRVFPSFCRLVSRRSRKTIHDMSVIASKLSFFNFKNPVVKFYNNLKIKFEDYFYFPSIKDFKFLSREKFLNFSCSRLYHYSFYKWQLIHDFIRLYKSLREDVLFRLRYIKSAFKKQQTRDLFLSRLFFYQSDIDVVIYNFRAVKQLNYRPSITNYV